MAPGSAPSFAHVRPCDCPAWPGRHQQYYREKYGKSGWFWQTQNGQSQLDNLGKLGMHVVGDDVVSSGSANANVGSSSSSSSGANVDGGGSK